MKTALIVLIMLFAICLADAQDIVTGDTKLAG